MNRERLEIGWYAVRPFLFYIVLFITIRSILYRMLESVLLASSADMTVYYEMMRDFADLSILAVSTAGAALPVLGEGRREIAVTKAGSSRAWITKRKDSAMLMGLLVPGTLSLSACLNLLLAGFSGGGTALMRTAAVPLGAAVYGILTPLIEEMLYRGIVWHRLRRGFSPLQAALLSSLLFGLAHGNLPQGLYAFVMGLIFALSYELTRRFEIPYLLHSTCNLAVLFASSAGLFDVLRSPAWILFFALTAVLAFGYWGKRLRQTKYKL